MPFRPALPLPLLLSCLWLLCAAPAQAGAITEPAAIARAAVGALGGNSSAEAAVDPNLRLAACAAPLQAVPTGSRVVQVRCPDAPGWRVYVPVTVRDVEQVLVLTEPVRAGETITADKLALRRRDMAGQGRGFDDPAALVGQTSRRGLAAGEPVTGGDVAEGRLLQRGDPVVLVSRAGGIEVRVAGRALGRAAPGSAVSVENLQSRRIIRGRLVGDGVVEVVR